MLTDLLIFSIPLSLTTLISEPIFWFSPFLVFMFYKKPLNTVVFWSLASGVALDLLSPSTHFGVIPLIMVTTTLFLYGRKQHFFSDSLSTFPIMTALYSLVYTLLLAIASGLSFTISWALTDLILMPLLDAFIAFIGITLPQMFLGPKRRKGEDYFL